jgi:glycosyltransferase involved in cell wall biosynthesis
MKKKILLIMPYGGVGGMERLALNLYIQYKKQGYEVKAIKLIQLKTDIIHFGIDEIAFSKVDLVEMSFIQRFVFYCKIPFYINRIVKKNKITHSISFGDMANVFSSLSVTKEYKIGSIHSYKSIEFLNKSFLSKIFKFSYRSIYYFFDKVVCISEAVKLDLINNCHFKFVNKLEVIYNPHNIDEIIKMSNAAAEIENSINIYKDKYVLFLGRITHVKSPWHLIKSFSLIEETENVIKLVFIGDGDQNVMNYLKELVDQLGINHRVCFLGRKSNPYPYLLNASVLALTSLYEGTPNVIVEAIACDTPIVTSNSSDGVFEIMCNGNYRSKEGMMFTSCGIITPTFYKGSMSLPGSVEIISEEVIFSEALKMVIESDFIKSNLIQSKFELLKKFDLEKVSNSYLKII